MHIINITVRDKIATRVGDAYYVCGNSDFVVHFDFDEEWAALDVKTARFIRQDGVYYDKVFSGSECPVPIISNTNDVRVGVFAGNLCTTTPARVPAVKSILCPGGVPAAPGDDVYNQIMERLNDVPAITDEPNMQLVTDDEGHAVWIPRAEEKEEETIEVVILPETEFLNDSGNFLLMTPWAGEVENGSVYTVAYNGAPYALEAIPFDFEGQTVPALGNLALFDGTGGDENAPFCLVAIPVSLGAQIGVYGILKPGDSPSAVTISVTGEETPDTSGPIFDVRVLISYTTGNGVEFGEADKTWPEVEKAHNAGKIIRVIGTMSDSYELSEYIGDIKAAHRANGMLALGFEMYTNLYMNEQGRVTRLMYGGDGGKIVFAVPD